VADDPLQGMDAPRPLPAEVRAHLEQLLLGTSAAGPLDAPRPLSAAQRARLEQSLVRQRRRPWLAGAAAAAVLVVGGAVLLPRGLGSERPASESAGRSASPAASPLGEDLAAAPLSSPRVAQDQQGGFAVQPLPRTGDRAAAGSTKAVLGGLRVLPASGPVTGGTSVRLSGADLRTVVSVRFGGRAGTGLAVRADGTVSVLTPASAGPATVDVTAVLADGRQLVAPEGFRYLAR